MSDTHAADHHGPAVRSYWLVFVLLCGFTAVSFVVNYFVRAGSLTASTGFIVILSVAIVKALLVCAIFMHLKWDWSKVYFMIVPALVLAPFLMFALLPDILIYWQNLPGWMGK